MHVKFIWVIWKRLKDNKRTKRNKMGVPDLGGREVVHSFLVRSSTPADSRSCPWSRYCTLPLKAVSAVSAPVCASVKSKMLFRLFETLKPLDKCKHICYLIDAWWKKVSESQTLWYWRSFYHKPSYKINSEQYKLSYLGPKMKTVHSQISHIINEMDLH